MSERMFAFLSRNHNKNGDTWNPLGGKCLHGCPYCYVEVLKKLFPGCRDKYGGAVRINPRWLAEIKKFTARDYVFACDCNDLFGHWVPTELIQQIFQAIEARPAKFLLLTKNPQRYLQLISIGVHIPQNCILGATIESNLNHLLCGQPVEQRFQAMVTLSEMGYPVMLSVEPIMVFSPATFPLWIVQMHPQFVAVGYDNCHKKLPEPQLAETLGLISNLEAAGITVYRKSLREAWNA